MDVSVFVYKNHQNVDLEGYDLQVLVFLIYYHSPEKLLQLIMTNYLYQKDILYYLYILTLV